MKKKQRQFLAMLLVLAMLVTTIGGTGVGETFVRAAELEETKEESNKSAETETEEDLRTMEMAAKELKEQAQLETWSDAKAFLEKLLGLSAESDELDSCFDGKTDENLSGADWQALCEKVWGEPGLFRGRSRQPEPDRRRSKSSHHGRKSGRDRCGGKAHFCCRRRQGEAERDENRFYGNFRRHQNRTFRHQSGKADAL